MKEQDIQNSKLALDTEVDFQQRASLIFHELMNIGRLLPYG